jgi:hypothetical protein
LKMIPFFLPVSVSLTWRNYSSAQMKVITDERKGIINTKILSISSDRNQTFTWAL